MATIDLIEFEGIEKREEFSNGIMVIGVGGAGGNAVNHMYDLEIKDVQFVLCNTDRQALDQSHVNTKIQLGEGLGAGNIPDKGRQAAIDSIDKITAILKHERVNMLFVTAGMGGGTGTGASPIIAKAAKDMGILTVGIVTMPFSSEGDERVQNAKKGLEELRKGVDTLLVINNDNLQNIYGELPIKEAFGRANDILATAAKGMAEIITRQGLINVDLADVQTVMRDSGDVIMGSAITKGETRVQDAVRQALSSPLLENNSVKGSNRVLFNITYGKKPLTLAESKHVLDYIKDEAGEQANIIWGAGENPMFDDELELTIIATGYKMGNRQNKPITRTGREWSPSKDPFKHLGAVMGSKQEQKREFDPDVMQKVEMIENLKYSDIEAIAKEPAYIRRKVNTRDNTKPEETISLKVRRKSGSDDNSLF